MSIYFVRINLKNVWLYIYIYIKNVNIIIKKTIIVVAKYGWVNNQIFYVLAFTYALRFYRKTEVPVIDIKYMYKISWYIIYKIYNNTKSKYTERKIMNPIYSLKIWFEKKKLSSDKKW